MITPFHIMLWSMLPYYAYYYTFVEPFVHPNVME